MNDDTPETDPVIDLTGGSSLDDVRSPYAAAQDVIDAAA